MNEGWVADEYFILFSEDEAVLASERYRIAEVLPGYLVIGLRGWHDFIVRSAMGATFTVPTVPIAQDYMTPLKVPDPSVLRCDERFTGKIKWYVKPIVFGGDPEAQDNVNWVSHEQHGQLVGWWNATYKQLKTSGISG